MHVGLILFLVFSKKSNWAFTSLILFKHLWYLLCKKIKKNDNFEKKQFFKFENEN